MVSGALSHVNRYNSEPGIRHVADLHEVAAASILAATKKVLTQAGLLLE